MSESAGPPGRVRVGTSGWRYFGWRGDFYPTGLPQRRELEFIGEQFDTVELNGSFYSLQRPASYHRWRDSVPEDFLFAVKGSRYLTHMLRLREPHVGLANFFASGVLALGSKLGPILWQLPERQGFDADVLEHFLSALPRTTAAARELARDHDARLEGRSWLEIEADVPIRHAIEPRSESFSDPALTAMLRRHGIALAVADTAGRFPRFDAQTADFTYIRLHGSQELYYSGYTDTELDEWAEVIRSRQADAPGAHDVFVYFDNDARGHAPHDARGLAHRFIAAGGSAADAVAP